jgi:hypothetical protein
MSPMHTSFRKSVKIDAVPNLHMCNLGTKHVLFRDCTCAASELT